MYGGNDLKYNNNKEVRENTGSIKRIMSRYQMLWRMLLTVVLLICTPILIVNWMTLRNIYAKTEQQNREMQYKDTTQFVNFFLSQQNEMRQLIYEMRYDSALMPETVEAQKYNVLKAIDELKYYGRAVASAGETYLYYRGRDYVISTKSQFRREFFANSFTMDYKDYTELDQQLSEVFELVDNKIRYIGIENPRNGLYDGMLVCIPARIKDNHDSLVMFHITSVSLREAYFGQSVSSAAEMMIFQGEKLMVSTAGSTAFTESEEFMALITAEGGGSGDIECGGAEFFVTKIYDSGTGLSFVMAAPLEEVLETESGVRSAVNVTMLFSGVMVVVLAALTIYINYRPIGVAVKKLTTKNGELREKGELNAIMDTLDDAMSQNEIMSRTISERNEMVGDFVMQRLLAGKSVSDRDLGIVRIPQRDSEFFIITLITQISSALTTDMQEQLLISIEEGYSCRVLMTQSFFEGQLILLVSTGSAGQRSGLSGCIAKEVLDFVCESGTEKVKLGVGTTESRIENIRSSYLSSVIAADQGDERTVSFYEQAVQNFSTFENYPSEKVLMFLQYIKQGNEANALASLDEIFAHIEKRVSSWVMERFIYYDIVNMFIKNANRIGQPVPDGEIGRMMSFTNASELKATMADMTAEICGQVRRQRDSNDQQMAQVIVGYVDENCLNQDISLDMAADHFGMSIYTFSTLFKRTAGVGFREYIVRKRLERARELLLTTDMTVKSIAAEVGYGDVSYFIRVFKNNFGETPTQLKSHRSNVDPAQ